VDYSKLPCGVGTQSLNAFLKSQPLTVVIDHTQMSMFELCAMKYNYVYNHNLVDDVDVSALYSQHLIHPMLANFYMRKPVTEDTFSRAWTVFTKVVDSRRLNNRQRQAYTRANAEYNFNEYVIKYAPDLDMYELVSSEETYWRVLEQGNGVVPTKIWLSKPDLVVKRVDDVLGTLDFKQSLYDINRDLLPFDRQFLGQAYTVGAKFIIKRHLQTILPTQRQIDGGAASTTTAFTATTLPVDTQLLDEWVAEQIQNMNEVITAQLSGVWSKQAPSACHAFNKLCKFKSLCSLGKTRDMAISTMEKGNTRAYLEG